MIARVLVDRVACGYMLKRENMCFSAKNVAVASVSLAVVVVVDVAVFVVFGVVVIVVARCICYSQCRSEAII